MYKKLLLTILLLCAGAAGLLAQSVETVTSGLFEPYGVAVDPSDNAYYFTDSVRNRVLRFHPEDEPQVSEVLVGLSNPQGIAFTTARGGAEGALVVADTDEHRILIVPLDGSAITTIGGGGAGSSDSPAKFRYPYGVAVDDAGNIYVTDNQSGTVRKIGGNNSVSTIATGFNRPTGIAVGNNQIFVANTGNNSVEALTMAGARAGSAFSGFSTPTGLLWLGGQSGLLVSDANTHIIWATGAGREFAGIKSGGSGLVNGPLSSARFSGPTGLALDNNGHVIVADLYNSALRTIKRTPVSVPVINFTSGFYSNAITLSITNKITPAGAEFRYTTDGSDPHQKSTLMTGKTLLLNGFTDNQAIIKIRGFSPDHSSSVLLSNTYSFFVDAPVFNVPGGNFTTNINLAISTSTEGAMLTYSNALTGETGVWNGTVDYGTSGPLIVQATKAGYSSSASITNNFGFTVTDPVVTPVAGNYVNDVVLSVVNTTPDTTFRYTLTGVTPTSADPVLPENFTLNLNALATNSLFTVRGFKAGYTNSAVVKQSYSFKVAPLSLSVPGGEYHNHTNIMVLTGTEGAVVRYTTDGSVPTATTGQVWVNGDEGMPFGTSGKLTLRAFKNGYLPSDTISQTYTFKVTPLTINPSGGTFTNDVTVRFENNTANTIFLFTRNGTTPQPGAESSNGTLQLTGNTPGSRNVDLVVVGTKEGYLSTLAVTANFTFNTAEPVVSAPDTTSNGNYINSVLIHATNITSGATIKYGVNGAAPVSNYDNATGITIVNTNAVKLQSLRTDYNPSGIVTLSYPVQVDKPVLSPANGFFPSGGTVTVSVVRADARVYFTTDGSEPSTNSLRVPADGKIKVDTLIFPLADLRVLKVRAFADNVIPSDIATGEVAGDNTIGIPTDMVADVGSEIVVPVVLNLKKDQIVRSFQFNVQVAAADHPQAALHNAGEISALSLLQDDLVAKADGSLNTGVSKLEFSAFQINGQNGIITNALSIYTRGTNSNFAVKDYGFVALLKVNIPSTAVPGDKYTIQVTNPSATEDAFQKNVPLISLPARTITVAKTEYLLGDSSPSAWYNGGGFGDGKLDNSDVNNALYASFGVRVPYLFTDLFNAMDVYPHPDPADSNLAGGDAQIRLLDYMTILDLSLRRSTNNYTRTRSSEGKRIATDFVLGGAPLTPAETLTTGTSGNVWVREASLSGVGASRVQPGETAEVPIYIQVARGKSVSGLMFRAQVVGMNGAPAVTEGVTFNNNTEIAAPQMIPMAAQNEVAALWDVDSINPALTGRKLLGNVSFKVPAGAKLGQAYRVQFAVVDGAPDRRTQYDVESFPAWVWIAGDAPAEVPAISDEWKIRFFGSINAVLADALVDADGDGIPNWKEFLAGTNPTDIRSRLNLYRPEVRNVGGRLGVALKFLSATGKTYVIESTSDLKSGEWTVVAEGVIGDGSLKELFDAAPPTAGKFYRIRLQ